MIHVALISTTVACSAQPVRSPSAITAQTYPQQPGPLAPSHVEVPSSQAKRFSRPSSSGGRDAPHAERYARILDIATNALLAGPSAQSGALAISVNPYPRPVTYHPFGGPGSAVIAWFSGDVGEVIFFDTALARDELAAISDALLTKWRL